MNIIFKGKDNEIIFIHNATSISITLNNKLRIISNDKNITKIDYEQFILAY